jgi:hypothetical protein
MPAKPSAESAPLAEGLLLHARPLPDGQSDPRPAFDRGGQLEKQVRLATCLCCSSRKNDNLCPDRRTVIKIDHVIIGKPDAARRNIGADCPRLVRTVDAIKRVLTAGIEVHGSGTKRIFGTAFHSETAASHLRHVLSKLGLTNHHFRGRIPVGPFQLMINGGSAGPEEALSTNANAIAYRFITALHQIKEVAAGIDDDCADGFVSRVSDYRARKGRVRPP